MFNNGHNEPVVLEARMVPSSGGSTQEEAWRGLLMHQSHCVSTLDAATQECSFDKKCVKLYTYNFAYFPVCLPSLVKKAVHWLFFWKFFMCWVYIGLQTSIGSALPSVPPISYYSSTCSLDSYCSFKSATNLPQSLCTGCCFCLECSSHRTWFLTFTFLS